jgi:hypothetical protein
MGQMVSVPSVFPVLALSTFAATRRYAGNQVQSGLMRGSNSGAVDPKRRFPSVNCRIAKGSFDHLVGTAEQAERKRKTERLRRLEIDD